MTRANGLEHGVAQLTEHIISLGIMLCFHAQVMKLDCMKVVLNGNPNWRKIPKMAVYLRRRRLNKCHKADTQSVAA